MAEQDKPNQNANKSKAEGERRTAVQNTAGSGDRDTRPERRYEGGDTDDAGGITNRPLSDEVDNQESLPARGTNRDQTADPAARRQQGDFREDER